MPRLCFAIEVVKDGTFYLSKLTESGEKASDENDYSEHWTDDETFTDIEELINKLRANLLRSIWLNDS